MPCLAETDTPFRVEYRGGAVHIHGKARPGKDKIKVGHQLHVQQDLFCMSRGLSAQRGQDGFDLFLFLQLQLPDVVVELHDRHRLDKECCAGGGLVVDHAGDLVFIFCFDGDTVPAAAHGDDGILKIIARASVYDGIQLCVDPVIGIPDGSADMGKTGTCVIAHLILREDASPDLRGERGERLERAEHGFEGIVYGGIVPFRP